MATLTELVTKFSFEGDTGPLGEYNEGLDKAVLGLAAVATAAIAATAAVGAFALSVFDTLDPLVQLQRTTDVNIEKMQELGFIASVSGSDLNAITTTVDNLTTKIGEASLRGSEDFARLGISVRKANGELKTADEVLLEVGDRFRSMNLSLAQQRTLASSLGIDLSLIQLLNRSREEIASLSAQARELGVVSKAEGDALTDVNDTVTISKFAFDGLSRSLALGIAPELKNLALAFTDLIARNRDWIKNAAEATVEIAKALFGALDRLSPVLLALSAAFVVLKLATIDVAAVMAVLASPVLIWSAAIAAALLIIDDLIVAFQGGQSVIKDFFQEFLGINITPVLQAMVEQVNIMIDSLVERFMWFKEFVSGLWEDTVGVVQNIAGALGFGDSAEVNVNQGAQISGPATTPVVSQQNSINQSNTINITANNAEEARVGVESALNTQLRDADDALNNGAF